MTSYLFHIFLKQEKNMVAYWLHC